MNEKKKKYTLIVSIGFLVFILLSLLIDSNISASFSLMFGLLGVGYVNYPQVASKFDKYF